MAELLAQRRDKELDAEIRRTADAQRYAAQQQAEANRYKVKAEAEAMSKKAEVYKQYGEAATLELLVSRLPDVARAIRRTAGQCERHHDHRHRGRQQADPGYRQHRQAGGCGAGVVHRSEPERPGGPFAEQQQPEQRQAGGGSSQGGVTRLGKDALRLEGGLGSVPQSELAKDVADVMGDGLPAEEQPLGDLRVR